MTNLPQSPSVTKSVTNRDQPKLSLLQCAQRGLCVNHQDRKGTPHPGDTVPYCNECKKEHNKKNKGL